MPAAKTPKRSEAESAPKTIPVKKEIVYENEPTPSLGVVEPATLEDYVAYYYELRKDAGKVNKELSRVKGIIMPHVREKGGRIEFKNGLYAQISEYTQNIFDIERFKENCRMMYIRYLVKRSQERFIVGTFNEDNKKQSERRKTKKQVKKNG